MRAWLFRALTVVCVFVLGVQGEAARSASARCGEGTYSFQTIDPPFGTPGADIAVQVLLVNNWGAVSAQYQRPPDPDWFTNVHGAIRRRGTWTEVEVPGAISVYGVLNNRGQMLLGYQMAAGGPWQAAIRDRRGLHPFPELADYPGGILANGLNDLGQIAAVVVDAAGGWHGFVGGMSHHVIVDYPDAAITVPMSLNDLGIAAGYYILADGSYHGFRYHAGQFAAIERPDAAFTSPTAVNNRGVVAGSYGDAAGEVVGFVLDRGRFSDVRFPGAPVTWVYSVNDLGQVAGTYCDETWGNCHGFVATPDHE